MNSTTRLQKNAAATLVIKPEPIFCIRADNEKTDSSKPDFGSLLIEAVDSAFWMLGDSNRQVLYFHLRNSFGISREAIPQNIEVFAKLLEQVFGQGALLLEAKIMETLHKKVPGFRFSPKQGELSFLDYLDSLRDFL